MGRAAGLGFSLRQFLRVACKLLQDGSQADVVKPNGSHMKRFLRKRERGNYDARAIANYIIQDSSDKTPLQLMKLVYFCHAWVLALTDKPLIRQDFKVWRFGPVIPDVYHALKKHGSHEVIEPIEISESASLNGRERRIVDKVIQLYGEESAWNLSALTHVPDSPWDQTRMRRGEGATIPNSLIRNYYRERRKVKN